MGPGKLRVLPCMVVDDCFVCQIKGEFSTRDAILVLEMIEKCAVVSGVKCGQEIQECYC